MRTIETKADVMLQIVVLERVDPTDNAFRFYVLSVEPTLFEDYSLVREWGRIGKAGHRRIDLYESAAAAKVDLQTWIDRNIGRGYSVCAATAEKPSPA